MMRFKMAQKVKVKPDMATYLFNTVMYKYLITKYPCPNYFQLMIVKMPLTKDKNMLYWYF